MSTRYQLSVCPHDTAKNLAGWFLINTYLQRRLSLKMHFEPSDNFNVEREQVLAGGYHLVYANPFSALQYHRQRGFVPLVRPAGVFDETLFVSAADTRIDFALPLRVASATEKLIVHFLGLTLLDQLGVPMHNVSFQFVGTHLKAARAVLERKADAGFIFNETWQGLSDKTRADMQVLGQTQSRQASHCFCISPELAPRADEIRAVLCGMRDDPAGARVLDDLRFQRFEAVDLDTMERLGSLVGAS